MNDKKYIVVINGSGGVGKDTFVHCVSDFTSVIRVSSVDIIKEVAIKLGWDGVSKTEKDRKFLSDLKLLSVDYSDFTFDYMSSRILEFQNSTSSILFLMIREPDEISRICKDFGAFSLLIRNDRVPKITTNMADDNVDNFLYDHVIYNNGSIEDLKESARIFVSEVLPNYKKNNKIITLCGSTKFKDHFEKIRKEKTLDGYIVLAPCCYEHSGDIIDQKAKERLIDVHKRMIDISDEVLVINVNGYIGDSTNQEIIYARSNNKKISYLEQTPSVTEYLKRNGVIHKREPESLPVNIAPSFNRDTTVVRYYDETTGSEIINPSDEQLKQGVFTKILVYDGRGNLVSSISGLSKNLDKPLKL